MYMKSNPTLAQLICTAMFRIELNKSLYNLFDNLANNVAKIEFNGI